MKYCKHSRLALVVLVTVGAILAADACSGSQPNKKGSGHLGGSGQTVDTRAFRLTAPRAVKNESTEPDDGNIILNYEMPYGSVSVEVFISTLTFDEVTRNGEVTKSSVQVAGVTAKRFDSDYSHLVFGMSDKPLIRYGIRLDEIPKPSKDEYTSFSIDLLDTQDIPASDVAAFKSDSQKMIDSLVIK